MSQLKKMFLKIKKAEKLATKRGRVVKQLHIPWSYIIKELQRQMLQK